MFGLYLIFIYLCVCVSVCLYRRGQRKKEANVYTSVREEVGVDSLESGLVHRSARAFLFLRAKITCYVLLLFFTDIIRPLPLLLCLLTFKLLLLR